MIEKELEYAQRKMAAQKYRIRQLEKEADWLAKECVSWMDAYFGEVATGDYDNEPSMQPEYWREKAREAVKDASSNS